MYLPLCGLSIILLRRLSSKRGHREPDAVGDCILKYLQNRVLMLLIAVAVLAACTPREPEPQQPEEPPPPTAAEVQRDITTPVQPLVHQFMVPWRELKEIPQPTRQQAMQQATGAMQRHLGGENGPEGIRMATRYVEEQMRAAFEAQAWPLTLFLFNVVRNISPGREESFTHYRDRALTFINMPRPTVTGFFQQGDTPVVFLDVFLPETGVTERVQVRESEEFHGMTLMEIKGNNRGAIVEHIETGEILDLDFPRTSR